MIQSSYVYIGNDSLVVLTGLKTRSGALITDAVVNMTAFVDRNGTAVSGVSLPLQLNHIGSGNYEAVMSKSVAVVVGKTDTATIVAVAASGLTGEWFETVVAMKRAA